MSGNINDNLFEGQINKTSMQFYSVGELVTLFSKGVTFKVT